MDYEPILIEDSDNVYSRYHWILGTIWTGCISVDDKPKVSFSTPWHVPVLHCKNYQRNYFRRLTDNNIVNLKNISDLLMLGSGFESVMSIGFLSNFLLDIDSYFNIKNRVSDVRIVEENIPEKYIFELSKCVAVVFIGDINEIDQKVFKKVNEQISNLARFYL